MGGSKPGFYQGSPVAERRIMGKARSSPAPFLWAEGHYFAYSKPGWF